MLRADRIDVWPLNNAVGAVVNLMTPSHVEAVFIAGKVKKSRGNLVGVDMPRILKAMPEARDGVLTGLGLALQLSVCRAVVVIFLLLVFLRAHPGSLDS